MKKKLRFITIFLALGLMLVPLAYGFPPTPPKGFDTSANYTYTGKFDAGGGEFKPPTVTVANLPGSPTDGDIAIVTDGSTASDCTAGGGTTINVCVYDQGAATWVVAGDGTGGAGSGSVTTLEEGDAQVGDADIVYLDFGTGFALAENPDTEVNINFDVTPSSGNATLIAEEDALQVKYDTTLTEGASGLGIATDGVDSQHYAADSIDNEHINWAGINNLADQGALVVADTTDTTSFVALFESATGNLAIKTDAGITYNAGTGALDSTVLTESGNAIYNSTETPGGELGNTWASPTIDDTGITLTSITIGALLGVDSIDATGAVDMDYGSADITDHTFTTDGGTVILDGSITTGGGIDVENADTTISRSGAGAISVEGNAVYIATGTDVALADGGTGSSLSDPNAHRLWGWDDTDGDIRFITIGAGLTYTEGTDTLSTTGAATAWDDLTAPDANEALDMSTYTTTWTLSGTAADIFTFSADAAFGDISIVKIDQNTGNPTDGTMLEIATDDADVDHLLLQYGAADYVTHKIVDAGTYTVDVTTDGTAGVTFADDVTFDGDITVSGGNINTGNIAFTVGDAQTDSITFTTDGTGTAEVALPTGAIDGTEILDDTIDSADYAALSIDAEHLAADIIDETKIADDGIDSEHYNDGSIDAIHLAADIIDETKIADDGIDSEHYNDGSIDLVHLAAGVYAKDIVTTAPVTGATDNVLVGADSDVTIALDFTAAWDFGGAASLEMPNGTSGTTDATGEFYLDTDGPDADYTGPVVQISTNGATLGYLFTLTDAPAAADDNKIIKYDAATNLFSLEADSTGSGLGTNLTSSTDDILSDNGTFLVGGTGNTNNETLDFDFETTANTVAVSTTSGVTIVDFGSIDLATDALDLSEGNIANVGEIAVDKVDADGAALALGDNDETVAIDSSDWDIDATGSITGVSLDADGTGNSISNIENADIKAAAAVDASKMADGTVSSAEFQRLDGLTADIAGYFDATTAMTTISIGGDPADAGTGIRLSNTNVIEWEDTEGTGEVTALTVDATEAIIIGDANASGVTITPDVTFSGAISSIGSNSDLSGAEVTLGTTHVNTLLDVNEEIDIDFDAADEEIVITQSADPAATINTVMLVTQTGSTNVTGGIVLEARAADGDVTALEAGDGTNVWTVSAAGRFANAGTADINIAAAADLLIGGAQINSDALSDVASIGMLDEAENLAAEWEVQDGIDLDFGNDGDWGVAYDETTDDALEFVTAATAAATATDPMFLIQVDSGAAGMTADQDVFAVYKGTTSLLELDEDGDLVVLGNINSNASGDSYVQVNNNASLAPSGNRLYVEGNEWKVSENGSEEVILTQEDGATLTGTSWDFSSVTNLVLPTGAADASGEISMSSGNQLKWHDGTKVVTIDTTPTTDNYVLKYDNATATFTLEADETGGTPSWDTVNDPAADATIAHDAGEETSFTFTGDYTTGAQFLVRQLTGNPSGGVLFQVQAADSDTVVAQMGSDVNYWQVSTAGRLSNAGTGDINLAAASDLLIGGGQIDTDDLAGSADFTTTGDFIHGADPADAGDIRLSNAESIMFEAAPAGTDINALSVDASEVIQIGASGASGVTITPAVTFSAATNLAADSIDAITEIAAALKAGADGTLLTGTAGTNTYTAVWNADGDLVDGYDPTTKAPLANPDFTGIVELPNATNPTTSEAGDIAVDSDDHFIEFYSDASRVVGAKISETFSIVEPDTIQGITDDVVLKHFMADSYPHGVTIVDIAISAASAYTSEVFLIEEWDDRAGTTQSTVESITISSQYQEDDGTLSDAAIAADAFLVLNLDDTPEDIPMCEITITYFLNAGD